MAAKGASRQLVSAHSYFEFERDGRAHVVDQEGLRREGIDALVRDAVFGTPEVQSQARYLVWQASQELGALTASIQALYEARGKGQAKGFTVPAMNIRGMTYDVVRAALRAARVHDVGALVFEIARSEMEYTQQTPSEYATVVLAAAIREGWRRPVFIQGDHFQFNAKKYAEDAESVTEGIRTLIKDALDAGFLNIDIDASTLVDLSQPTVPKQQALNARLTAEMVDHIRGLEPAEIPVSVGGEIGEVGKKNSTEDELRAYLDQLQRALSRRRKGATGISKVSIQTGTTHGGLVGPDGKVLEVAVDFDTIERLTAVAVEEYHLAGVVQHGASTLPDEMFHLFPKAGAAEIHLATGFQNALYDHPQFPADLKKRIYAHLDQAHADERKPNETSEQFHYKTRKKGFGPFKRELWDMDEAAKTAVMKTLEERFGFLYRELKATNTSGLVKQHVQPMRLPRQPPLPH
jgi:fructose/tagatose bisphosphate aldolase